ncbi:MAG: ankyrin repeat domain-containing protein [Sphingobacteriia bacterium]|nr:ankyrin repeat domain-containing protein [Sphingobacteriia bacterium]NCC40079.1 ankyrin repeat domain-containing protein [Gammaproteobacteria bacterium]
MILVVLVLSACTEPAPPTLSLERAADIGDMDQIKRHIYWKSPLDQPNAAGDPPLHVAARAGRVAIARELALHGASVDAMNTSGETPLQMALANGRTQVAQMLVDQGARLEPQSMLIELARSGRLDRDVLNFLLSAGASLDRPDTAGDAPLHVAIASGQLSATRRLIAAGANVNQPDGKGRLPLQIARESAPGRDARFIISTLEQMGARAGSNP